MAPEILIVPSLNGSPDGHWQRIWADEDPAAELVEQEDWARPRLTDWLHGLEAAIASSAPGVILIAHSLGCSLVAALAGRPAAAHVGGALLVAPADIEPLMQRQPAIGEFATGRSRVLPFTSILVASRNDPFMSFRNAEAQAKTWGSTLFDVGPAGHVNIASGFGRWDDASTLADGLRGRSSRSAAALSTAHRWWCEVRPEAAGAHDAAGWGTVGG